MLYFIIFFFLNIFIEDASASDTGCIVTGKVKEVRLGSYNFTSNNKNSANRVSFTELVLEVISADTPTEQFFNSDCEKINQQKEISVGLCEEQTIIVGDVIKGDTGGWENGPDCLIDVKFIFKAKRDSN